MNRWAASTLFGVLITGALLLASSASAATLVGDYQFQDTRASSGAGAPLADLGAGTNTFQSDTVMGSSRRVLTWPLHNGLKLNPTGTVGSTYSVVTTFRVNTVSDSDGYVRILDSTNGTSDGGFYVNDGKADYYDLSGTPDHESSSPVISADTYVTVAMTQTYPPIGSALSSIYVNGTLAGQGASAFPVTSDTLRFFKDNESSEESAGAVSCIRVYDGALTGAEVAAIGASPTCGAPTPATVAPKRKCRKHKKRSAESAKKKCRKHKKH